ncbi:MAG: hypothetical protein O3A58_02675 [Proteobacteria bacterium]|nr:hypothetical protein [Pseudomonadota bacterium]MDA1056719.1 hypothetical protein [Pseudomonadota bacterium]
MFDKAQILQEVISKHQVLIDDDHLLRERLEKLSRHLVEKDISDAEVKHAMNDVLILIEEDAEEQQREDDESPTAAQNIQRKSLQYFELKRLLLSFREDFNC